MEPICSMLQLQLWHSTSTVICLQDTNSRSFVAASNLDLLTADLLGFTKKQMDYILGANPQQRSYMLGFGKNFPQQPHHRGASNPVMPKSQLSSSDLC
ncbi:endoglucanase 16-like [Spinacia oleracea]|uniref:cellulase n=1 Tax=Spinacia oleracea TaxID=3562 RepID=A0ABM3R6P2_SPIOL|nr:endoglucanase 16-like [Spinacia oleracea]